MKFPPALPLLCALWIAGCATQPPTEGAFPWRIPARSVFLSEMPPPPPPGSAEARQDLATVLALQARATPAKIAEAKWSYELSVFTFARVLSPQFTAQNYPQTAAFFHQLNDLVCFVNDYVKDAYRRPHPFQVSAQVKRFVIAKPGYSYPSYHSARCVVFGNVLAELDPARKAEFDRLSRRIEEDRVFAGEHFPSDIAAGIRLGKLIWSALEKDANFRRQVIALKKAEWTPPPQATR